MAGEIRTSVIVNLAGNLAARARQFTQSMRGFGAEGSRSMSILRNATRAGGQALDRLGNRYTALITGAAGAGAARMLVNLEARLVQLGIQANTSAEDMDRLKREVFGVAQAAEIRVSPDQLLDAIDGIIEKTGDLRFAQENIRNMGIAIRATGATGKDIGELFAEFQKLKLGGPKAVLEAFDTLNIQGKEGAFTLQNLAALGPRVIQAYAGAGRSGATALQEMGAALQLIRMGTGSSEQAATAFEALVRTFGDPAKLKLLQQGGIQVFDPEMLKEGKEVLRPINQLMVEIIRRAGGRKSVLGAIFDAEALRAFNVALAEFQRTGGVPTMDKFMRIQGSGAQTLEDSARAAKTAAAGMTNLATAWKQFADDNLTAPIQGLADALNSVKPETVQTWMKVGAGVVGVVGAAIAARKLYQGGRWAANLFRVPGKGGAAGGLGGAAGGMAPIPVWVVNSGAMPGGAAGGAAGKALRGGALGMLGKAGLVGGVGAAGFGVGTLANMGWTALLTKLTGRDTTLGTGLYELLNRSTEAKIAGELNIRIDSEGRASVTSMKTNQRELELTVDTGAMMVSP